MNYYFTEIKLLTILYIVVYQRERETIVIRRVADNKRHTIEPNHCAVHADVTNGKSAYDRAEDL